MSCSGRAGGRYDSLPRAGSTLTGMDHSPLDRTALLSENKNTMRHLKCIMAMTTWLNERLGRWFISYLALAMFALLLIEVIARYVLAAPTVWATELTQMLFGAYAMLSGGYLLVHGRHVSVDIFHARFSPRRRAFVDVITSVLFFCFMLVLLKEGWSMAADALGRMETSHSAWNPPVWPLKLTVPIGALLLMAQGIVKLLEDLFVLFGYEQAQGQQTDEEKGGL